MTITDECPATVTAYETVRPGTAAQGMITNNLASGVETQGFSGDTNHSATVVIGSAADIAATSLCSTAICPAGGDRVNIYIDIASPCGTPVSAIALLSYLVATCARACSSARPVVYCS